MNVAKFIIPALIIGYLLFRGSSYEVVESEITGGKRFINSEHGYSVQLPNEFIEPAEACPLRTSGFDLLTYFTPPGGRDSGTFFIVGQFDERNAGFIKDGLLRLENKEIDEATFKKEITITGNYRDFKSINGYTVYPWGNKKSKRLDFNVMFISNGSLVGFMLSSPIEYAGRFAKVIDSLESPLGDP